MQQPGGQTGNGGAPISNGGARHHCPPAGDGPAFVVHVTLVVSHCILSFPLCQSINDEQRDWGSKN